MVYVHIICIYILCMYVCMRVCMVYSMNVPTVFVHVYGSIVCVYVEVYPHVRTFECGLKHTYVVMCTVE